MRYCRVAQGGLEVTYELEAGLGQLIFLLLPPECSGDRQMPPCLAQLPVQVRLKPTLGWNASSLPTCWYLTPTHRVSRASLYSDDSKVGTDDAYSPVRFVSSCLSRGS